MTKIWPPLCDSPEGYCAKTCKRCSCPEDPPQQQPGGAAAPGGGEEESAVATRRRLF